MTGSLKKICKRELRRIFTIPAFYIVLFIIPPILFCFYGLIYSKEKVQDLPVVIWDEDQSALSRELIFLLQQTESINLTHVVSDRKEMEKLINTGEAYGGIHFPENMEKDIKRTKAVTVGIFTNAASLVPSKLIYKDAMQVLLMANGGVILSKLTKKGMEKSTAMFLAQPIKLNTLPLFNPTYNYIKYLLPGLTSVTLQMVFLLIGVLVINYEKKTKTEEELQELSGFNAFAIIGGKFVAYFVPMIINYLILTILIFPLFGFGFEFLSFKFFFLLMLMLSACLALGMLVSALFDDIMFTTDVALFFSSPAFVFSGFTFPRWAMPWYDQYYAVLMPYTHFVDAYFKIGSMNLPLQYVTKEITVLLAFIVISFLLASMVYGSKIRKQQLKPAL